MFRVLLLTFLSIASFPFLHSQTNKCSNAKHLLVMLEKMHYQPVVLDSTWSEDLFLSCFDALDPSGDYFTEEDLKALSSYKNILSENIENQSCTFIDDLANTYQNALKRSQTIISDLSTVELDYTKDESFWYSSASDHDFYEFAQNKKELTHLWKKNIKYRVLVYWLDTNDSTELSAEKQHQFKQKAIERYSCQLTRKLASNQNIQQHVNAVFLEQLAKSFDPHTAYFSSDEKDEFEDMLSVSSKSFGIIMDENEGVFSIDGLIPGSSAWNSNELNENDIITEVKFKGEEIIDFSCMTLTQLTGTLASKGDKALTLTVQKSDGQKKEVTLMKTEIDVEDNVITSFVLAGEKKIGYINLPSFYTDFESDDTPGCANDVAKELIKLKREGVDGIILDLRYNGGGSIREAQELAGIFINQGALGMSRYRDGLPATLKDINRGTMYNGPLTVLVNGYSASASEFVAAAIQDHNRGIIVGDTTYGKATGQIILPVGKFVGEDFTPDDNPDYIKTTVLQLYRVTGISLQSTGVIPDVIIPDPLKIFTTKESDYPNHIIGDTVIKEVYYTPLETLPSEELQARSTKRISTDSIMRIIVTEKFNQQSLDQELRLSPEYILKDLHSLDDKYDYISSLKYHKSSAYKVLNNQFDQEVLEFNPLKKELNQQTANTISQDVTLQEVYNILLDLIQLQAK